MKSIIYLLGVIGIGAGMTAFDFTRPLNIGDGAPLAEYTMESTDGTEHSLTSEVRENGLLVIFSCNTCPYVLAWEDQYPILGDSSSHHGIGMLIVNSNEAKRPGDDSMEAMQSHAEEMAYNTPYVLDANHQLADAFGAQTTPHVYLFDKDLKLVFEGSINDKFENKDKRATDEWLQRAMRQLANGQSSNIEPADTRQIGCSIKRQ